MGEKEESITQKWSELAETVAREYLRKRNEEVLHFFGIDPDEDPPASSCSFEWYPAEDCRNDRLYWVEVLSGVYGEEKFAAWRAFPDRPFQWVVATKDHSSRLAYADDEIRVIYEIPED